MALDAQLSEEDEEDDAEIDALCERGRFYGTEGEGGSSSGRSAF
ncbi:hypothetical protein ACIPX0_18315 [Streptomyces sp. NPDC090075]